MLIQESTRLGEYGNGEWVTQVSVIREGNFTRSGPQEVDEIEIFEGNENTLMMTQTYTLQFQCEYTLRKYPFDAQVKHRHRQNVTGRIIPSSLNVLVFRSVP